ncbi:MAG TPA: tripartite tricarboxylate transporter substrate binding protein [Casimicrobiaceae bacterium]|nr:tripartite tricarboxylate transporter substrate binding protein [Casimicrobiaceae bacterium]
MPFAKCRHLPATRVLRALLAAAVLALSPHAAAQAWPAKPIKLVAPSTPGDAPDVIARLFADKLSIALGQSVVVENKPGAGGVVGSDAVAKAAPDGYTLIMGNAGSHGINAAVYANLPYDIQRDFAPVSQVAVSPNVMVINPSVPANTVAEFIAYAKSRPGKLSYASGGNGSSAHMSMELFKSMAGVDIEHIPYKGSSPALTDVVSGQVAVFIGNMPPTVPLIKAGKLRALAVTTKSRSALMPELPTIAESGLPGFETVAWFGVLAPAGTPPEIVHRLSAEIAKIARSPEMREKLLAMGAEPVGGTPEEFKAVIDRDIAKWKPLAQKVGIKID